MSLIVNVGRCGPDVVQLATPCAEHERASGVHHPTPAVTTASEAGKPSKHVTNDKAACLAESAKNPRGAIVQIGPFGPIRTRPWLSCSGGQSKGEGDMNGITRVARGTLAAGALCGALTALAFASPAGAGVERATATAKEFRNCTALNRVYPHGVGRVGARDKTSGTPVRNFKRSNVVYRQNKKSDRDGDGIACEKA